jgi:signal transduction histidine kinase
VWGEDGRLLWSDLPDRVGSPFNLPPAVRSLFGTTGEVVRVSASDDAEDVGIEERSLLVVYVGAVGEDGLPFVLQGYFTPERIDVDADAIFAELLPLGVGTLLLFQLAVLPLAYTLARRVDRGRRQRMELLDRSIASWHHERRRLAQDLHDGVIQHLSGASYTLPPVLDRLPDDPESRRAREAGEQVVELLHRDLVALRSLVMDLLPPDLAGPGLAAALEELAEGMVESPTRPQVRVRTQPGLSLSDDVAGIVYRVVREGLRNVARHADAQHVEVDVASSGDLVTVRVVDDGRGPTASVPTRGEHVGLRLLAGLLADVGGTIELRAGDCGGAVLEARVPAVLRS